MGMMLIMLLLWPVVRMQTISIHRGFTTVSGTKGGSGYMVSTITAATVLGM